MNDPENISRQLKYQREHIRLGLCRYCASKLATKNYCLHHAVKVRERQRKSKKRIRRNQSITYRLERAFRLERMKRNSE